MRGTAAKRAITKQLQRSDPEHIIAGTCNIACFHEAAEFLEVGEIGLFKDTYAEFSFVNEFSVGFIDHFKRDLPIDAIVIALAGCDAIAVEGFGAF